MDSVSDLDKLCAGFATLPEIELRALCASLSIKRTLVHSMTNSKENLDGALDALDELMT